MINSPIYIFDSIGCKFSILNGNFLIGQPLVGYSSLNHTHIGSYIPYLVRNKKSWEVGVGFIRSDNLNIFVERIKIIRSSNNDSKVDFIDEENNTFFVFANESNFNVGFNNVIVKNTDFSIEKIQAIYLIDSSNSSINCSLPDATEVQNLVVELKSIGYNPIFIRNNIDEVLCSLNENNSYIRIVSNGKDWIILNDNKESIGVKTLSFDSSETFQTLSNPVGDNLSFQYNNAGSFAGSQIYYGSGNKLLFGTTSEITAHNVIPASGNSNTIFNNDKTSTNFIVQGSGNRNLFYDYRGRLGLNIPSGSTPDTIVHIINTTCREGLRLENRTACHPANITLYYKPSSDIPSNTTVAEINLSAKNSLGNQVDYATIESKALTVTAGSSKGQLNITVATTDAAGTGVNTISTDPDRTIIGYSGNNVTVNNNGLITIGYSGSKISANSSSVTIQAPTINFNSSNIVLGTGAVTNVNVPILYSNHIQTNTIKIQNIAENSILSLDASGNIIPGTSVRLPIQENKILTTTTSGAITGVYDTTDYFLTNGDILWSQYEPKSCSIAGRQILFDIDVQSKEFSVDDQVEVIISGTKYYRTITDIQIANSLITEILLNQNLTTTQFITGTIQSVTKGGYLSIKKSVDSPAISNSTENILSIRPLTDTEFNTGKKDINFSVYGLDEVPALSIRANYGRTTKPSGFYHAFASQRPQCEPCVLYYPPNSGNTPFPIVVNSGGSGLSTQHVSANFDYAATGIFSGMLTTVGTNGLPSYYGTYDQNGNAAEWLEDNSAISTSNTQYVAGGSWKTLSDAVIKASGLKNITPLTRASGYSDVGFRVAAQYNITDNSNIATALNIKFVPVSNPNNLEDTGTLYAYQDNQYLPIEIPQLGTTNKNYRIGQYEITNSQYTTFLNAVATTNDRNLYKSTMSSSQHGGITRTGDGSSTPYEYTTKTNMANKPVVFVDYLSVIRFTNWLHNGAPLNGITDIDTIIDFGAYDIFSIGESSYLINKNIYQKYWLPNLNEWHKAAYFEPRDGLISDGTSAVTIKRDEPYTVASGTTTEAPLIANMSVSGWLYVDHLIVGDNTGASSVVPRRTLPAGTTGGTGGGTGGGTNEFSCNTTSDCQFCEVCSNGLCVASTDLCCVSNCCLAGGWNPITEFCDLCSPNCNIGTAAAGGGAGGSSGSDELPCEILGTCT